jgi:CheY-like chemotaxis protein
MDYEMPVLDGLAAARELAALPGPPLPVVMVSSRDDAATREAARAAGIGRYLVKPVSLAMLQSVVAEHAAAWRAAPNG